MPNQKKDHFLNHLQQCKFRANLLINFTISVLNKRVAMCKNEQRSSVPANQVLSFIEFAKEIFAKKSSI